MTYIVSSGALNSTHSLTPTFSLLTGRVVWPTSTFDVVAHVDGGPTGPPGKFQPAQSAHEWHDEMHRPTGD